MVNQDNDPHSEILSNNDFAVPEGGYPAPYVPEGFPGLFLPKPRAPGMIICGYSHTSLQDHPLNCWGHSYTEGHDKIGMHPTCLGLVETGIGYTESIWVVKSDKEKYCTAIRRYHELFLQPGFRTAAMDTWGGLHFLPLITTIFLSQYKKDSFMLQLDSGVFGFNRCKGTTLYNDQTDEKSVTSTNPYQAYMVVPIMKGGFKYISMSLMYKLAIVRP